MSTQFQGLPGDSNDRTKNAKSAVGANGLPEIDLSEPDRKILATKGRRGRARMRALLRRDPARAIIGNPDSPELEVDEEDAEIFTSSDVEGATPKQRASSWFASAAVHAVIILILAMLFFPGKPGPPKVEAIFSTEIGDQLDVYTKDEGNLNPTDGETYEIQVPQDVLVSDLAVFEREENPFVENIQAPAFEQSRVDVSEMLNGRTDPGLKNDLLAKYGGNKLTEAAVEAGLKWLQKQQQKDGSWSLKGPYKDGVTSGFDNPQAASALALLAFQGAGNTTESGKYSKTVRRGWAWLIRTQNRDGSFIPEKCVHEAPFYTHALCTLALCELLTMEKKKNAATRKKAELAVAFLLETQHASLGGWRYVAQVESDLSVTSWCLMALRTAEMAGIEVPKDTFDRISKFLDSVSFDDGAGYVYRLNGSIEKSEQRPSMTAAGLMCREYLGWGADNPALVRGAQILTSKENLMSFPSPGSEDDYSHNVYGWYATSMALKGLGPYNRYWRTWNGVMSRDLPANQEPEKSSEAGSWNPKYDEYAFGGGRLYVTALSILCLEVYYRHIVMRA